MSRSSIFQILGRGSGGRGGLFNFDLKSLSLFRIAFSTFLFYDSSLDFRFFKDAFTDGGVLPRSLLLQDTSGFGRVTVLALSDAPIFHDLFLAIYFLAIVCFCIGYRTRLATILLAVAGVSLYWRNPLLVSHVPLLRNLLLIFACFLPLNRYWSVDAALDPEPRDRRYPAIPFMALKLQISSLYFFAGMFKLAGATWLNGVAVAHALESNVYGRTPLGLWVVHNVPEILPAVNYAVVAFQLMFTLLVYCPYRNSVTRGVALAGAFAMHFSFLIFLTVGTFPEICFCYLLILVPDSWIDRLLSKRKKRLEKVRIFYDDDCAFCRKVALLLREFCLPLGTPVEPSRQDPVAGTLLRQHNSWVLYDAGGQVRLKWDAVAYVLKQSPVLFPLGWLTDLSFLKPSMERLYDLIGARRSTLGRFTALTLPWRTDAPPGPLAQLLCAFLAFLMLFSNIALTPDPRFLRDKKPVIGWVFTDAAQITLHLAELFQMRQMWNIFAPDPHHLQQHVVIKAHWQDGGQITYGPHHPMGIDWFDNRKLRAYWGRYLLRLSYPSRQAEREALASYLCRRLNQQDHAPEKAVVALDTNFYTLPINARWPVRQHQRFVRKIDETYTCPSATPPQ